MKRLRWLSLGAFAAFIFLPLWLAPFVRVVDWLCEHNLIPLDRIVELITRAREALFAWWDWLDKIRGKQSKWTA